MDSRTPQIIEDFLLADRHGGGTPPEAPGALSLDVWHTQGDWEAPDEYGTWFVVSETQPAYAVAVQHDGHAEEAVVCDFESDDEDEGPRRAPPGSCMPATMYHEYVSGEPVVGGAAALTGAHGPGGGPNGNVGASLTTRCVIGPLVGPYPPSTLRLVLRDATVLLRLLRDDDEIGAVQGGGGQGGPEDVASALVEVHVRRVCCQVDVFAQGQLYTHHAAVALHEVEVVDWGPTGGASSGGYAPSTQNTTPPRVLLGPYSMNRAPSGADACMVCVKIEGVCPNAQGAPASKEVRLTVAGGALRVSLDQGALLLIEQLGNGWAAGGGGGGDGVEEEEEEGGVEVSHGVVGSDTNDDGMWGVCGCEGCVHMWGVCMLCVIIPLCDNIIHTYNQHPHIQPSSTQPSHTSFPHPVYFQYCEFSPLHLVFDYTPRRFDLVALRNGRLVELLNLIPLGGVDLQFQGVVLGARQGGGAVAAGVLSHWLEDITSTQVGVNRGGGGDGRGCAVVLYCDGCLFMVCYF